LNNYPILCKKCKNESFVFRAKDEYNGRITDFIIVCAKCGTLYAQMDQILKDIQDSKDSEKPTKQ